MYVDYVSCLWMSEGGGSNLLTFIKRYKKSVGSKFRCYKYEFRVVGVSREEKVSYRNKRSSFIVKVCL